MTATLFFATVRRWLLRGIVGMLPLALAACGGGYGGVQLASGGIVGTGDAALVSVGTISALGPGSVTVNGVRFGTSGATIRVNGKKVEVKGVLVAEVLRATKVSFD